MLLPKNVALTCASLYQGLTVDSCLLNGNGAVVISQHLVTAADVCLPTALGLSLISLNLLFIFLFKYFQMSIPNLVPNKVYEFQVAAGTYSLFSKHLYVSDFSDPQVITLTGEHLLFLPTILTRLQQAE